MNIAFWSNVKQQSGVTSSVALVSVLWIELFAEKVAVTANHICNYGLEKRLYDGTRFEEATAKKAYSYCIGEPEYFRIIYSNDIKRQGLLSNKLCFFPMEKVEGRLFETDVLFEMDSEVFDAEYVLIDTACGYGRCSQKILEKADIKVILLPPNRECIDSFFEIAMDICENSFFIIGRDLALPSCRPSYLTKKHKIPKERVGVIPYDRGYEQAMKDGSVISYVMRNMNCSKRNSAYRFIWCSTKTVKRLREYVMYRRKHVCGGCESGPEEESCL